MTANETVGHFINHHGVKLIMRRWVPAHPKALMILLHGFGDHSRRHRDFAAHFMSKGYAVAAFDQPGHGESAGRRGDVETFEDWHLNAHDFVREMRTAFPDGVPIIVVGHSVGGAVALECAVRCKPDVAAFVISAPALRIRVAQWKIVAGKILPYLCPLCRGSTGIAPENISRVPSVVEEYAIDPLVIHRLTLRAWRAMILYLEKVRGLAEKVHGNILIFQECDDPVCDAGTTEDFYRRMPKDDARLILYDGAYHEPMNDAIREQVYSDVERWLEGVLA